MLVNYSLIFMMLVLFAGLAVDVGMLERNYLVLQGGANAAVAASNISLQRAAGGTPTSSASAGSIATAILAGKAAASANGFTDGVNGVAVTITITAIANSYSSKLAVTITESIAPGFMGILGLGKINMKAQAAKVEGVPVNLTSYYNIIGIYTDGHSIPSNGGFGGNGYAFSANLLGQVRESNGLGAILSWRGQIFSLAAANAANGVSQTTVNLPRSAPYSQLLILASTAWGYASSVNGVFVVTYTDSSTATSNFDMSDWCQPKYYAGETIVSSQAFRLSGTSQDYSHPNYIYGYSINVDKTRNLSTLKLPPISNVVVFAIDVMP
jgi:hypothetical protein